MFIIYVWAAFEMLLGLMRPVGRSLDKHDLKVLRKKERKISLKLINKEKVGESTRNWLLLIFSRVKI